MTAIDWTAIFGIIAVLLIIAIRAGIGIHDLVSSGKTMIHDDVKIPVEHLGDKVDRFGDRLHEFITRESQDHRNLLQIMSKSNKSHQEIIDMMRKLNADHSHIHDHDKIIKDHTRKIDKHDNEIASLNNEIKKRGNYK